MEHVYLLKRLTGTALTTLSYCLFAFMLVTYIIEVKAKRSATSTQMTDTLVETWL